MSHTHELIEARAYGLYLERNGSGGSQLDDWLKAEKEIEKGTADRTELSTGIKRTHSHRVK